MPKMLEPKITLTDNTGSVVAQVTLPIFCLEHMKHGQPVENLKMMLKHLSSAGKLKIGKLYTTEGKEVTGLHWTQCEKNIEFRFD